MRSDTFSAIGLATLLLSTAPAGAQSLIERGGEIAVTRCGVCHATGPAGDSPHRIARPFRELHKDYPVEMLSRALRTGIVSGHDEMPMFEFSRQDIDALLAYIDSLGPAGAPRYSAQTSKR
jgi:mono/diheme cytochrome c family protein